MPRYIALLRGINVGGHRVKMDELRGHFESLGFDDVATFIASGNVVFSTEVADAEALTSAIEEHLESELGYSVATFLRTNARMTEVAALEWPDALDVPEAERSHYVMFLHTSANEELRGALDGLSSDDDTFRYEGQEVHWLIRGKVSESPLFGGALEKAMKGVPNTMRNMTSVRRMAGKYGS